MQNKIRTKFLSDQRLNAYLDFNEYQQNLLKSKDAYILLCLLEISLRNSINNYFCKNISSNWFENDFLNANSQKKIKEVKLRLKSTSINNMHNKIISELSFGFWTALFRKDYSHIMRIHAVKSIFPNLPQKEDKFITRDYINKKLNHIRVFRNKIFHYDKIINKKEFENIESDIYEILELFDKEILDFTKELNNK